MSKVYGSSVLFPSLARYAEELSAPPRAWRAGLIFLTAFILAQTSAAAAPVSAERVLQDALEARGGREAFLRIDSFHAKGTVWFYTADGPWWEAANVTNVWPQDFFATRSGRSRFAPNLNTTAPGSLAFVPPRYFAHGQAAQTAWEAWPGEPPRALTGWPARERNELAQGFAWCAEASHYQSLTNLGETDFEGRRCYELRLVRPSGIPEMHYYDVTNHLLAGLVRSSLFGPSLERFTFENYQAFGGFRFPTRIGYRAEDERYQANLRAEERYDAIELNCVSDSQIAPPPAPAQPDHRTATQPRPVNQSELQARLDAWIQRDKVADSIVVGWLDEQGRGMVASGEQKNHWYFIQTDKFHFGEITTHRKVDGDTIYPLASISKVFTRVLLMDMVQRGAMRLDDPVQQYLPASVHMPTRHGKPITLLHLATHTSGLPRYFGGPEKKVYDFLSKYELQRDPGAQYEYSNTGMGLLGKVIERKAGQRFQALVKERICRPLGMHRTRVMNLVFPGVDGVESSANDLLTFASACLGLTPAPPALEPVLRQVYATHGGGGGGGYVLDLTVDRAHRRALVILASNANQRYGTARATLQRLIQPPAEPSPQAAPNL